MFISEILTHIHTPKIDRAFTTFQLNVYIGITIQRSTWLKIEWSMVRANTIWGSTGSVFASSSLLHHLNLNSCNWTSFWCSFHWYRFLLEIISWILLHFVVIAKHTTRWFLICNNCETHFALFRLTYTNASESPHD